MSTNATEVQQGWVEAVPILQKQFADYDNADRLKGVIGLNIGRLVIKFAPKGKRGQSNGNNAALEYFAAKTDWSRRRLEDFRDLAHVIGHVPNEVLLESDREGRFSFEVLKTVAASSESQRGKLSMEDFFVYLNENDPDTNSGRWTVATVEAAFVQPKTLAVENPAKSVVPDEPDEEEADQKERNEALVEALGLAMRQADPEEVINGVLEVVASFSEAMRPLLEKLSKANVEDERMQVAAHTLHALADELDKHAVTA